MNRFSRRTLLLSVLSSVAAFSVPLRAQDAPDDATFSTAVNVVNVFATVRDAHGQIVRDLTKENFEILENGRPQNVRYFVKETDLPLTVGLLVDTSMSQQKVLNAERGASLRFLDQVLRERKDQFFIMQFDMGVMMRQELTASRRDLNEALSYVDTPSRGQLMSGAGGGGTLLYDAVVKAANDVMAGQKNRKAFIILSDGVDYGSSATLDEAVQAAQKAGTLIYSILFSDAGAYGSFGGGEAARGERALMRLAKDTGGGFFEVTRKLNVEATFDLIQADLRSQYNLGYTPNPAVTEPQFRKLQVTVKPKGLVAQAPSRYYARPY